MKALFGVSVSKQALDECLTDKAAAFACKFLNHLIVTHTKMNQSRLRRDLKAMAHFKHILLLSPQARPLL